MALIVQKFGGTSVGSVERIEQVADKVKKFRDAGDDLVVVLSAMSGETNRLIDLAKQASDGNPEPREIGALELRVLHHELVGRGHGEEVRDAERWVGDCVERLTRDVAASSDGARAGA